MAKPDATMLTTLPVELLLEINDLLEILTLLRLGRTCKAMFTIISSYLPQLTANIQNRERYRLLEASKHRDYAGLSLVDALRRHTVCFGSSLPTARFSDVLYVYHSLNDHMTLPMDELDRYAGVLCLLSVYNTKTKADQRIVRYYRRELPDLASAASRAVEMAKPTRETRPSQPTPDQYVDLLASCAQHIPLVPANDLIKAFDDVLAEPLRRSIRDEMLRRLPEELCAGLDLPCFPLPRVPAFLTYGYRAVTRARVGRIIERHVEGGQLDEAMKAAVLEDVALVWV